MIKSARWQQDRTMPNLSLTGALKDLLAFASRVKSGTDSGPRDEMMRDTLAMLAKYKKIFHHTHNFGLWCIPAGWRPIMLAALENARLEDHKFYLESLEIIDGRLWAHGEVEDGDSDDPGALLHHFFADETDGSGNEDGSQSDVEDSPDALAILNGYLERTANHCCLCGERPLPESRGDLPICQECDTKFDLGLARLLRNK